MPDGTVEPGDERNEAFWREFLVHGDPAERTFRRLFSRIPSSPRCKACAVPFDGIGGRAARLVGKRPSNQNPRLCTSCFSHMIDNKGGATIECTMLFADIRGSTTIAEAISPTEFQHLLRRFYHEATEAVFSHDGSVDKFVGDEVVAMFFPLASGDRHAAQAVAAARDVLHRTGHAEPGGPWLPVGAGVHTGDAWVGAIGDDIHVELTAVGDAVNTAARLASAAAQGEILISDVTARAAGLSDALQRSPLALKGKAERLDVVRLGV